MRTILLHGKKAAGRVALVDDTDYELVSRYRWCAKDARHGLVTYAVANVKINGRHTTIMMHKLITGWPRTDHHDHDGLNNQRSNLRAATSSQNGANRRRSRSGSSQFKGVSWVRREAKWHAQIGVNGTHVYLGSFTTEHDAARAYDTAARAAFGQYACVNFPDLPDMEPAAPRTCTECEAPIPRGRRTDARYCSERCRKIAKVRAEAVRRRELNGWRKRSDSKY